MTVQEARGLVKRRAALVARRTLRLKRERKHATVAEQHLAGAKRWLEQARQKLAALEDGHLWGGSRAVTNEVVRIVNGRAVVTSRKRAATDPLSLANPGSDHNEANMTADAVDFAIANAHTLKNEIAERLTRGRVKTLEDYGTFTVTRNGGEYRVQIIAGTHGTGPHLHVGVKRIGTVASPATRLPAIERRASKAGIEFIAGWEGFRSTAYKPVATEKYWTIGFGHYGPDVRPGSSISRAQGLTLLRHDAQEAETTVRRSVKVPVTQNEFDALVSLTFNIGSTGFQGSTVLRELNLAHRETAANAFLMWNKGGGQVLQGLVNRRKAEAELFRKTN